jgi:hypothetical protein
MLCTLDVITTFRRIPPEMNEVRSTDGDVVRSEIELATALLENCARCAVLPRDATSLATSPIDLFAYTSKKHISSEGRARCCDRRRGTKPDGVRGHEAKNQTCIDVYCCCCSCPSCPMLHTFVVRLLVCVFGNRTHNEQQTRVVHLNGVHNRESRAVNRKECGIGIPRGARGTPRG